MTRAPELRRSFLPLTRPGASRVRVRSFGTVFVLGALAFPGRAAAEWEQGPEPEGARAQAEAASTPSQSAEKPASATPVPVLVDRVVARFSVPETGGTLSPHYLFERELAFEARIEALADPTFQPTDETPYRSHHLQAALERHIAETLLASLNIAPAPSPERVDAQIRAARVLLTEQVGGALALQNAARAEGLGDLEVRDLLRRKARASLYLDQMVAPMLEPSEAELRRVHRSGKTPFQGQRYGAIASKLRRWYVARRLGEAALAYYQNARARLTLEYLPRTYPR